MKRIFATLMLLIFALAVACGNTSATVTTEGTTETTVKGEVTPRPVPHNMPFY